MSSSISSPLLLLSLPLLTVSTWTPKCDGTSEPKDLHGRSYALLHAHRLVFSLEEKYGMGKVCCFSPNTILGVFQVFPQGCACACEFSLELHSGLRHPLPRCCSPLSGPLSGQPRCFFHLLLSSVTTFSGSDCTPKRTKVEEHKIVVYVNATPYCTTIQLEHHRGPCR